MSGWRFVVGVVGVVGISGGAGCDVDLSQIDEVCTVTLPADVQVVRADAAEVRPDRAFWVCDGGTLSAGGADPLIVVASGGSATGAGAGAELWVQRGGKATLQGADAQVYVERLADAVAGGAGATITRCGAIEIDASAVADGC